MIGDQVTRGFKLGALGRRRIIGIHERSKANVKMDMDM